MGMLTGMADTMGPSEFGGKVQRNGVQPFPHEPTASEKLSLVYRTGSEAGDAKPDGGVAFAGLLPTREQRAIREAMGDMDKGQVWDEMQQAVTDG